MRHAAKPPPAGRVRLRHTYEALLVLGVLALWGVGLRSLWFSRPAFPVHLQWWAILPIAFVGWRVQITFKQHLVSSSLSMISAVMVLSLFTTEPLQAWVAATAGVALAEVHRGVRALPRMAMNLTIFSLALGLGELFFHLLSGAAAEPSSSRTWVATGVATLCFFSPTGFVIPWMYLHDGRLPNIGLQGLNVSAHLLSCGGGFALVQALWVNPPSAALLLFPFPFIVLGARASEREWAYRQMVNGMRTVAGDPGGPVDLRESLATAMKAVREMFGAESAEALVTEGVDGAVYHLRLDARGHITEITSEEAPAHREDLLRTMLGRHDDVAPPLLMAATLAVDGEAIGALLVSGRTDETAGAFDSHDRHVFEVFSRQVVSNLRRGELERSIRDLSARQAELTYESLHDPLTGLGNRALFMDRLEHALQRQNRTAQLAAVVYIDLDDLKKVNDGLGHAAGDLLLIETARRLQRVLRSSDTPARLGGDEFAIVLEDVGTPESAHEVAERLVSIVAEPVVSGEMAFFSSASVGVAVSTGGTTALELVKAADAAMYEAKRTGKGRCVVGSLAAVEAEAH